MRPLIPIPQHVLDIISATEANYTIPRQLRDIINNHEESEGSVIVDIVE